MHRDVSPPMRVKLNADVDREDTILGSFTARQVAILAAFGGGLWLVWAATKTLIPSVVFLAVAVPVGGLGFALAVGRRDGISLDRWLAAWLRHRRNPTRYTSVPSNAAAPKWITAQGESATLPVAPLKLPARGITGEGLIDLGPDGSAALIGCTTVNFGLRSNTEQHGLVGGYARWLNSLDAPVQILVRARRVDLSTLADRIDDQAIDLADPQLEGAARYHAGYLRHLTAERELLHRQVTVILRDTRSPAHTWHRAADAARTLAACEINAVVHSPVDTAATWAESVAAQPPPPGQASPDAVIRATPYRSPS